MFNYLQEIVLTSNQQKAYKYTLIAMVVMVIGSIGIDQVTKYVAEENLMIWSDEHDLKMYQGKRHLVFEIGERNQSNFTTDKSSKNKFYLAFSFNYVRNQGAAWGLFSDWDDIYRVPFFYLITLVAVAVIFSYWYSTPPSHRLARFTLALILSGALGNFTDRIFRGYVVDFLDFRWVIPLPFKIEIGNFISWEVWQYSFPNFNWADSTISVGVFLLAIDMFILDRIRTKKVEEASISLAS